MPNQEKQNVGMSQEVAKASEIGSMNLSGAAARIVFAIAISMSMFQLFTGFYGELPGSKQLSIHLAFALVLCYLCFPLSKKSSRNKIAIWDIALALLGGATALYLFFQLRPRGDIRG